MSVYDVSFARLAGPTIFRAKGHDTPMGVDLEGVLTVTLATNSTTGEAHGACIVANGTVVKGIRFADEEGDHPDLFVDDTDNVAEFIMIMLFAEDGGSISVVHESGDVTELRERISVNDGADTAIDAKAVQVFFYPWLAAGVGRVRANDWAGV